MTEVSWRPIKGYEDYYEVSSTGLVKRLKTVISHSSGGTRNWREKILKPQNDKDGYKHVRLSKDGKIRTVRIHRLVCEAFLGNAYSAKNEINHIDLDKANNSIENLEVVSRKENAKHASDNGKFSPVSNPNQAVKLTYDDITEIKKLVSEGMYHKDVASKFNVHTATITAIVNKRIWKDHV